MTDAPAPTPPTPTGASPRTGNPAPIDREYAEALFKVFEHFAFVDQRSYYRARVQRSEHAGNEVNLLRAGSSLIAGTASALAALLVALNIGSGGQCAEAAMNAATLVNPDLMCNLILPILAVTAVIAPAFGAAFTTIADLYQWDRTVSIYRAALENLEVADALSPQPEDSNAEYWRGVHSYAKGTLDVMSDETAQWGTLIRTPQQITTFQAKSLGLARATNAAAYPETGEGEPDAPADGPPVMPPGG
jgi:hypothetical protein